jgi:hypothetical protein
MVGETDTSVCVYVRLYVLLATDEDEDGNSVMQRRDPQGKARRNTMVKMSSLLSGYSHVAPRAAR